ncbi:hypothetical protein KKG41_03825 [Patescibacteria group bacterium]|nr:hypothetical protein [Patescibacteria group bacterium]MBU1890032.1 hypothetical protein [Patescibacteria group bacterium]
MSRFLFLLLVGMLYVGAPTGCSQHTTVPQITLIEPELRMLPTIDFFFRDDPNVLLGSLRAAADAANAPRNGTIFVREYFSTDSTGIKEDVFLRDYNYLEHNLTGVATRGIDKLVWDPKHGVAVFGMQSGGGVYGVTTDGEMIGVVSKGYSPSFTNDGRLAVVRGRPAIPSDSARVWFDGTLYPLNYPYIRELMVTPDGTKFIYIQVGSKAIWMQDIACPTSARIIVEQGGGFSFSPTGDRLLYENDSGFHWVSLCDCSQTGDIVLPNAAMDHDPSYLSDGVAIVFSRNLRGCDNVMINCWQSSIMYWDYRRNTEPIPITENLETRDRAPARR